MATKLTLSDLDFSNDNNSPDWVTALREESHREALEKKDREENKTKEAEAKAQAIIEDYASRGVELSADQQAEIYNSVAKTGGYSEPPDFSNVVGTAGPTMPIKKPYWDARMDELKAAGEEAGAVVDVAQGSAQDFASGALMLAADNPGLAPGGIYLSDEQKAEREKLALEESGKLHEAAVANQELAKPFVDKYNKMPGLEGAFGQTVFDIAQSPSSAASLVGGPAAILPFSDVYFREYGQARRAGLKEKEAHISAAAQAIPEGALSIIPARKVLSKIPGVGTVMKKAEAAIGESIETSLGQALHTAIKATSSAAGEGLEEGVTGIAQDAASRIQGLVGSDKAREYAQSQTVGELGDATYWASILRQARAGSAMAIGPGALEGMVGGAKEAERARNIRADRLDTSINVNTGNALLKGAVTDTQDTILEDQRVAAEKAKQQAFDEAEKRAAEQKELEEEAGFQTLQRGDVAQGSRVERYAGVVERVPTNPAREVRPEDVAEQRDAAQRAEAERLERVRQGKLVEEVRKERERLAKGKQAELKGKNKAEQKLLREQRGAIRRELIESNPDATDLEIGEMLEERMKNTPPPQVFTDPIEKKAASALKSITTTRKRLATSAETKRMNALAKRNPNATPQELAALFNGQPAPTAATVTAPVAPVVSKPDASTTEKERDDAINKMGITLRMAADPKAPDAKPNQVTLKEWRPVARKVIDALVSRTDGKSRSVQTLINQGKLIMAPNAKFLGREDLGSAAEYDPADGKMYLYTDNLDPNEIVSHAIEAASHEGTHGTTRNQREGRAPLMQTLLGKDGASAAVGKIRTAAKNGNKIAQEAVRLAEADTADRNGDDTYENEEILAYFTGQAVANRDKPLGTVAGVVKDMRTGVRSFLRDRVGLDLDVDMSDLNTAAQRVLAETAKTDLQPGEGDTLRMIAGKNARDFDKAKFKYQGRVDGLWRFEVPDIQSKIVADDKVLASLLAGKTVRLGDLLSHEKLYDQYPATANSRRSNDDGLADIQVYASPNLGVGVNGQFEGPQNRIGVAANLVQKAREGDTSFLRSVLLHEVQHAVQKIEGFVAGANKSSFLDPKYQRNVDLSRDRLGKFLTSFEITPAVNNLSPTEKARWERVKTTNKSPTNPLTLKRVFFDNKFAEDHPSFLVRAAGDKYAHMLSNLKTDTEAQRKAEDAAFRTYLRDYGEGEARNTQTRADTDEEMLALHPPEETMGLDDSGVPVEEMIDTRPLAATKTSIPGLSEGAIVLGTKAKAKSAVDNFKSQYEENPLNPNEVIVGNAAIDLRSFGGKLHLQSIRSLDSGNNSGREALQAVKNLANDTELSITVDPVPFGPNAMSQKRLIQWYKDNGFTGNASKMEYTPTTKSTDVLRMAATKTSIPGLSEAPPTQSQAFKDWFGDSMAVNEDGTPRRFYTGTSKDTNFTSFRVPKNGAWFTANPEDASQYALENDSRFLKFDDRPGAKPYSTYEVNTASRVFPVYLRAENPYVVTDADLDALNVDNYKRAQGAFFDKLRREGYDSVIFGKSKDDFNTIAIIDSPTQVKSVLNDNPTNKSKDVLRMAARTPKQVRRSSAITDFLVPSRFEAEGQRARVIATGLFANGKGLGKNILTAYEHAKASPAAEEANANRSLGKYEAALQRMSIVQRTTPEALNNKIMEELDAIDKESNSYDENLRAYKAVVGKYGEAGQHLLDLRNQVDNLTLEMLQQRALGPKPDAEEAKTLQTLAANMGRYSHRLYAAHQGKAGKLYAHSVLDAYRKGQKGKTLTPRQQETYDMVHRAVKVLIDDSLMIPDDAALGEADAPRIERLYRTWGDRTARDVDEMRDQLADKRDEINTDKNRLQAQAEVILKELLDIAVGPSTSPIATYYRGAKQDRGILQERTFIPAEIRAVMGEITDPATRLLASVAKQAEFVARTKFLLEVQKFARPEDLQAPDTAGTPAVVANHMTRLEGEAYGPLNGWYASPNLQAMLSDVRESIATFEQVVSQVNADPKGLVKATANKALDIWVGAAGLSKRLQIVGNLFLSPLNFLGSFGSLALNGNMRPDTMARGIKDAIALIRYARNPSLGLGSASDAVRYGVTDSATVGELKGLPYQKIQAFANEMAGKKLSQVWQVAKRHGIAFTELYAMMDVWAKIANFHNEVSQLQSYYKKNGEARTDEEIKREAADIVNSTNITYKRALPLIKGLERGAITNFGTYFYETFRAQLGNARQGIKEMTYDVAQADTAAAKAEKLTRGAKRLAGQAAFWVFAEQISSYLGSLMFGDDDDEWDKRDLFPEYMQNQDLYTVGLDKDGMPIQFSVSRIDPYGPVTDIMRQAMAGGLDYDQAKEQFLSLYVKPRMGPQLWKAGETILGDERPTKEPIFKELMPSGYEGILKATSAVGMEDRTTRALFNLAESVFLPGTLNAQRETNPKVVASAGKTEFANFTAEMSAVTRMLGATFVKSDPAKVAGFAKMDYDDVISNGRKDFARMFDDRPGISEKTIQEKIKDVTDAEYKEWSKLARIYRGMQAVGMSQHDINAALKEAKVTGEVLKQIKSQKFEPTAVSKKSFDGLMQKELKGKSDADKKEIKTRWAAAWKRLENAQEGIE